MSEPVIAVIVTLNSKSDEGRFLCEALTRAGAHPWMVDTSLRPHDVEGASFSGEDLATAAGVRWADLAEMDRRGATEIMIRGGRKLISGSFEKDLFSGAIGIGGANGTAIACSIMRTLPLLVPKAMVSVVAATAAVQWYVGESDIAMFPSIGDISLNRITRGVMENAARAVAAMAKGRPAQETAAVETAPLVAVSSFGGTAGCVRRVEERLKEAGYEVILLHASGPGGQALESLARHGELTGVVDVTTSELTDLLVDGVYSSGEGRLREAGAAGIPQVVVPGALDHANFWMGEVPERFRDREFLQYNAEILLMRTNAEEFEALGRFVAERLNEAKGGIAVMIPRRGFSEHTKRTTHDLAGRTRESWLQPETDAAFARSLRSHLKKGRVEELDLHINDPAFGDACVRAFLEMMKEVG